VTISCAAAGASPREPDEPCTRSASDHDRRAPPAISLQAVEELEDLGSPIGAFIRDRCVVEAGQRVVTRTLFGE
jgi:hypothetical protein